MIFKSLAFILGFTCFIVQMVMLREFLSMFMGNELMIAIILGMWMLLMAAGAWMGKMFPASANTGKGIFYLLLLSGITPMAGLLLLSWSKYQFFTHGLMISLQGSLLLTIAGLLLFCLVAGIMFTLLAKNLSQATDRDAIARIYAIEALGSLGGGLAFNFILVYKLDSIQLLYLVMWVNLISASVVMLKQRKRYFAGIALLLLFVSTVAAFNIDLGSRLNARIFPGQHIIDMKDTPYGKLVYTEKEGQRDIYLSGQVVASSGDIMSREEKVHYSMSLHPDPANILMLMGGLDGAGVEVAKYAPLTIDYVDPDPWAIAFAEEAGIASWPDGIKTYITDPTGFLKHSTMQYDVIMLNGPEPNTVGNNRFFTREFFMEVKRCLSPVGIFALSLAESGNYLHDEQRRLFSSIYTSMLSQFSYIRIIPGNKTFMLASEVPINGNITELIEGRGILNEYVNRYYILDELIAQRSSKIMEQLDDNARINTNSRPVAAYHNLSRWFDMIKVPLWLVLIVPLLIMGLMITRMSSFNLGLFATGFTASSGEFLLLMIFQCIYGYIYQMAGLIIMIFMAGLFAGAGIMSRLVRQERSSFIAIQVILGLSTLILPLLLKLTGLSWLPGLLIGTMTFIIAALTGILYKLASILQEDTVVKVASSTYGSDLAGSAFGIFFMGVFVFPLLGIMNAVLILVILNITVSSLIYLKKA